MIQRRVDIVEYAAQLSEITRCDDNEVAFSNNKHGFEFCLCISVCLSVCPSVFYFLPAFVQVTSQRNSLSSFCSTACVRRFHFDIFSAKASSVCAYQPMTIYKFRL